MATALIHNRVLRGGFPVFTFSGSSTVVDDGTTSGTWKIALTSSGTMTIGKKIRKATIQGQGGGGGGGAARNGTVGSDGSDGSITTLTDTALESGNYAVDIGAAGARGNQSAGYAGGATTFGAILHADGGAGGARGGGSRNQEHKSVYGNCGKGGLGGSTSDYTGSYSQTTTTTLKIGGYTYIRTEPKWNASTNGTISSGTTITLVDNYQYPDTGGKGNTWYRLKDGRGYIDAADCETPTVTTSDTRRWYGIAGNAGAIIISGRAR